MEWLKKRESMSTTKSRTFDREFKINAVKLYESSGRSIKQLSEELGVSKSAYG
jgi:transposase-like protein